MSKITAATHQERFFIYMIVNFMSDVFEAGRDEHCEEAEYNVGEIITPVT